MTKNKTFKRVIAGAMACALVAGTVPAQTFDKGWFGFAPVVASAEGEQAATELYELTVNEGTVMSLYSPAYIYYFDDFTKSQFIVPAEELQPMAGKIIDELRFYTDSDNIPYTTVSLADVYLKEVDHTNLTDYVANSDCETVYTGSFSIESNGSGGGIMTIELAQPFEYDGGNLLIGIDNIEDVDYQKIYFRGKEVTGGSIAGYNSSNPNNVPADSKGFVPETTFVYEDAHDEYSVSLTGGNHAVASGGALLQTGETRAIDKVTFTAEEGYWFNSFEDKELNGIKVKWINETTVIVSGIPSADTEILVPDAVTESCLTVYDDQVTNEFVPIYAYYVDDNMIGQYIIPETDLESLSGKNITGLRYYSSSRTAKWGNAVFDVYLTTTESTTLDSLVSKGNCTTVYSGSLSVVDGYMTIRFNMPLKYKGGNLLIGIENTQKGSYNHTFFYGQTVEGASIGGYTNNFSQKNFIPKTSIYYEDAAVQEGIDISTATVTVNTTAKTVSAELDGESLDSEGYTVKYYKANDETDEGSETFPTEGGKYIAKITADPDGDYEGEAQSEVFVIDKLTESENKIACIKNGSPYTRFIFVVAKSELKGVKKAQFTVSKDGRSMIATSTKYYTSSTIDGVKYTPASSDNVLFTVSITGTDSEGLECQLDLIK